MAQDKRTDMVGKLVQVKDNFDGNTAKLLVRGFGVVAMANIPDNMIEAVASVADKVLKDAIDITHAEQIIIHEREIRQKAQFGSMASAALDRPVVASLSRTTFDDLMKVCKDFKDHFGESAFTSLIQSFGVNKMVDVPQDERATVIFVAELAMEKATHSLQAEIIIADQMRSRMAMKPPSSIDERMPSPADPVASYRDERDALALKISELKLQRAHLLEQVAKVSLKICTADVRLGELMAQERRGRVQRNKEKSNG